MIQLKVNGAQQSFDREPEMPLPVVPARRFRADRLAQVISDGKGGMPSFKSSLSEEQIHALVTHIRSLHPRK